MLLLLVVVVVVGDAIHQSACPSLPRRSLRRGTVQYAVSLPFSTSNWE
jgi:hypothetical protein